jgi:RNA polymerase sigma-70 factor (ECF subfamily)
MPSHASAAVERAFRSEGPRILAWLIRRFGDWDLAEDALQDAVASALERWPRGGIPQNPGAWLTTAARNRAIDRLRKAAPLVYGSDEEALGPIEWPQSPLDDDVLRLMFTCCHPALALEAQVALTLRAVGGLTTPEIARAFLIPEPTLAQRLARAKRKIQGAGIPYRIPEPDVLPERLAGVLGVLYLVFNEGYAAGAGETQFRADLCAEAIRLARLLHKLMPTEPEIEGLLALMLLQHSRRAARCDNEGTPTLLEEQDRSLWDHRSAAEGRGLVREALARGAPGPYQIQAAIAAVHSEARAAQETDWPQIVALYDALLGLQDGPVIRLNRAVAVAMRDGPQSGLALLADPTLAILLADYRWFHSARAELLRRSGQVEEAREGYRRAIDLCENAADTRFLRKRLSLCGG